MGESKLRAILDSAFRPPDGTSWTQGDDVSHFYRNWGFTIYRTAYGPATDQQWSTLLAKINEQVLDEIDTYSKPGPGGREEAQENEENAIADQLRGLFRLDPRSDVTLLGDKGINEVRAVYKDQATQSSPEDLPLMHDSGAQRIFLLADADVLEGVDRDAYFWVKCVEADHEDRPVRNTRMGPPWLGWMKMTTRSVVDLSYELPVRDLENISPGRGGDSKVYNGELTGMSLEHKTCSGK